MSEYLPDPQQKEFDPLTLDLENFHYPVPVFLNIKEEKGSEFLKQIKQDMQTIQAAAIYFPDKGIFVFEEPEDLRMRTIWLAGAGLLTPQVETLTHEFTHVHQYPDYLAVFQNKKLFKREWLDYCHSERDETGRRKHNNIIERGFIKILLPFAKRHYQPSKSQESNLQILQEIQAINSQNLKYHGRFLKSQLINGILKKSYKFKDVDKMIASFQAIESLQALGKDNKEIATFISETKEEDWDSQNGIFTNMEEKIQEALQDHGLEKEDLPALIDLYKNKKFLEVVRAQLVFQQEIVKKVGKDQIDKLISHYGPALDIKKNSIAIFPNNQDYQFNTKEQKGFILQFNREAQEVEYFSLKRLREQGEWNEETKKIEKPELKLVEENLKYFLRSASCDEKDTFEKILALKHQFLIDRQFADILPNNIRKKIEKLAKKYKRYYN